MAKVIGIAGKIGSGKGYFASNLIAEYKNDGKSVAYTAYADPLKDVLERFFGLKKTGFALFDPRDYEGDGYANTKASLQKGLWSWQKKIVDWDSLTMAAQGAEKLEFKRRFSSLWLEYGDRLVGLLRKINADNYDDTFRQIIQLVGTEFGRGINDKFWILATFAKVKAAVDGGFDVVVIDDVRFPNEKTDLEAFCQVAGYECEVWGITAPDEVRAKRRNMTVEEMLIYDQHGSERFIDEIIGALPKERVIING